MQEGNQPFKHVLVGLKLGGNPIEDHPSDFWLISTQGNHDPIGWITSILNLTGLVPLLIQFVCTSLKDIASEFRKERFFILPDKPG